jgi:hypothetical protein
MSRSLFAVPAGQTIFESAKSMDQRPAGKRSSWMSADAGLVKPAAVKINVPIRVKAGLGASGLPAW